MAMKRERARGREAPMVISPRDVARLFRQVFKNLRRKETEAEREWAEKS